MTASQPAEWAALSFATNLEGTTMNANAPNTASCTTCCVCCKEIPLDAAFTPEGAEYVEHFCGLDCYERFQARAKAATESDIAPVPGGSQPSD